MLPAYAGMILVFQLGVTAVSGAPRVCGDDPQSMSALGIGMKVLPAYAGMIPRERNQLMHTTSAPRVCGDDPLCLAR